MVQAAPPPAPLSTRSATRKAIFDHVVLKDVMGFEDDDLLTKALDSAGIASVPDLLVLTDEQIDNLEVVPAFQYLPTGTS